MKFTCFGISSILIFVFWAFKRFYVDFFYCNPLTFDLCDFLSLWYWFLWFWCSGHLSNFMLISLIFNPLTVDLCDFWSLWYWFLWVWSSGYLSSLIWIPFMFKSLNCWALWFWSVLYLGSLILISDFSERGRERAPLLLRIHQEERGRNQSQRLRAASIRYPEEGHSIRG